MSICASGSSRAKAGVASSVVVDANYVKSLLPAGWEWLYEFIPLMRSLQIGNVGAFCINDPPSWSMPTAADFIGFLAGGETAIPGIVNDFLGLLFQQYIWYKLCECSSGATPTAPAATAAPVGTPIRNPSGLVSDGTNAPCLSITYGPRLWPTPGGSPFQFTQTILPSGATSVRVTVTVADAGGSSSGANVATEWLDARAVQLLPIDSRAAAANSTTTWDVQVPNGASKIWGTMAPPIPGTNTVNITVTQDVYCGNNGPNGATGCCPPDATLMGYLARIEAMVTLMQRQNTPFAYIPGTVHPGLSGQGSFGIFGILGVKVEPTVIPSQIGIEVATPTEYYELGTVALGTADGYDSEVIITHSPHLILPPRCSAYTQLAYTLHPGVTATITELKREP